MTSYHAHCYWLQQNPDHEVPVTWEILLPPTCPRSRSGRVVRTVVYHEFHTPVGCAADAENSATSTDRSLQVRPLALVRGHNWWPTRRTTHPRPRPPQPRPEFVTISGRTGAYSGEHTQPSTRRVTTRSLPRLASQPCRWTPTARRSAAEVRPLVGPHRHNRGERGQQQHHQQQHIHRHSPLVSACTRRTGRTTVGEHGLDPRLDLRGAHRPTTAGRTCGDRGSPERRDCRQCILFRRRSPARGTVTA